jgi:hypothetical protein
MLSALLVRVAWVILGQFWLETKAVINLFSSIFIAPFLIVASIFYLHQQNSHLANSHLISSNFQLAVLASGLVGLFF